MTHAILVTGGTGQVGQALRRAAWPDGFNLVLPGRGELDLSDPKSIDRYVTANGLAAIVNCAAYTAVDRAEDEPDAAYDANARGAGWLARAARVADIPMVHVSTDYVFGSSPDGPHHEEDEVGPLGVYGASKLAGEIAVAAACDRLVIVRTAWIVSPFRSNFVKSMLRLASDRTEIGVVSDQLGCPTGADDIADALSTIVLRMINDRRAPTGIYHFANSGEASWANLAEAVMAEAESHGMPHAMIKRILAKDFPTRAARPIDSRLDISRISRDYDISPRHWSKVVVAVVAELAKQEKQGS